jgi:hypothetical protein
MYDHICAHRLDLCSKRLIFVLKASYFCVQTFILRGQLCTFFNSSYLLIIQLPKIIFNNCL